MKKENRVLILRDVLIPGGRIADITIINGRVSHTGSAGKEGFEIHCRGKMVLPAGVDMHVHMRDGAQKYKETWETGTKSAIAGGVTFVVDQPNSIPPLTTCETFKTRLHLAQSSSYCRFALNGAVTPQSDLEGLWKAGSCVFGETFVGPSSYGEAVDSDTLSQAMSRISEWNGLMTIHAERVSSGKDESLVDHNSIRSIAGEIATIRDVIHKNKSQCRLHFCHLSSAAAINTIPKDKVTIEVTPHHLFLSHEQFKADDTHGKVNPPLRTERERKELFSCWNKIDVIASDHAPHSIQDKDKPFEEAPSGIPGVETMIPLLMYCEREKKITIPEIIKKTSINPSRILGSLPPGYTPGSRADFALYPDEITQVDPDELHSNAKWSPFEGMNAIFPECVILDGNIVYQENAFTKSEKIRPVTQGGYNEFQSESDSSLWFAGRGYCLADTIGK